MLGSLFSSAQFYNSKVSPRHALQRTRFDSTRRHGLLSHDVAFYAAAVSHSSVVHVRIWRCLATLAPDAFAGRK
jgi:hypothetical protein